MSRDSSRSAALIAPTPSSTSAAVSFLDVSSARCVVGVSPVEPCQRRATNMAQEPARDWVRMVVVRMIGRSDAVGRVAVPCQLCGAGCTGTRHVRHTRHRAVFTGAFAWQAGGVWRLWQFSGGRGQPAREASSRFASRM
jgi:hypothetical protein